MKMPMGTCQLRWQPTVKELQRYVHKAVFQNISCYDGLLTFTFGLRVADVIVEPYQDHKQGEWVGIPIEPSVEELVDNETDE